MATTTFSGVTRSYGGRSKGVVSPGVLTMSKLLILGIPPMIFSVGMLPECSELGLCATSGELFVLTTKGISNSKIQVVCNVVGTAIAHTVDIGTSGDTDGFLSALLTHTLGTSITGANGALVTAAGITDDATGV